LISNASDANDKLRFEALAAPELLADHPELDIRIAVDAAAGTLEIMDSGIGMSAEEIVTHLGTIARSGTAEYLGKLTGEARHDSQLIGQFGVGFYSAFIVADRVEVQSRRAGLPPELVLAVIDVESNFDRFAISSVGARGLMQVMPFWLDEIGRPGDDLFDIHTNLRFGCTILKLYLDRERGDRTRARLVEAALDEFREHGFERASIARIAEAAGVSRPSFYFHFPKKEDLLREVIAGFEAEIAGRVARARTVPEVLDALVASILDIQERLGPPLFAEVLRVQTREPIDAERSTVVLDEVVPESREKGRDLSFRVRRQMKRALSILENALS